MDSQGSFAAALLDNSSKAIAAGAVAKLREQFDEAVLEGWGFGQLVADAEMRLRGLAEALAVGHGELMELDGEWLAATYRSRGIPLEVLDATLANLRTEVFESLPSSVRDRAAQYLGQCQDALENAKASPADEMQVDAPHAALAASFLVATLESRRNDAIDLVLAAMDDGVSVKDLHRHVIERAQIEIGRLWQMGEVHSAEEHLGTKIVEEALVAIRNKLPRTSSSDRKVLVASVEGNRHDIGARIVADQFEISGWHSIFLGADSPSVDVVMAVEHFGVHLVALSAGLGLNLRATASLIAALKDRVPGVPVIVGGRPFCLVPDLWRSVGADGTGMDAAAAVVQADGLVTS